MSQGPQIEVPYPPTNGGQQCLGMLVAFVRPSITCITRLYTTRIKGLVLIDPLKQAYPISFRIIIQCGKFN